MKIARVFLTAFLATGCALYAEDKKDDTSDAAKEQAVVDKLTADNEMATVCGKLTLGTDAENKKAFKVAGTIAGTDKVTYSVILMQDNQYDQLAKYDNTVVNMVGYVTTKENVGKAVYFDHIEVAAPLAPAKKKRGGL